MYLPFRVQTFQISPKWTSAVRKGQPFKIMPFHWGTWAMSKRNLMTSLSHVVIKRFCVCSWRGSWFLFLIRVKLYDQMQYAALYFKSSRQVAKTDHLQKWVNVLFEFSHTAWIIFLYSIAAFFCLFLCLLVLLGFKVTSELCMYGKWSIAFRCWIVIRMYKHYLVAF